ncbi:MAG: DNA-protecting protein DprA [Pseudomonadota bacterium]|jgi:DNA processing protein
MERDELSAWLRLVTTPGLGRDAMRRLLAAFGSPEGIFLAPPDALQDQLGTKKALAALARTPDDFESALDLTQRWLAQAASAPRYVLSLGDPHYPSDLLQTADPPLLLYAQGRLSLLGAPKIAIVGSRNPTPQGVENARAFARHLSQAGWTVVSGLALGIDGAAHEGALQGEGSTIAVVGTGLDRVYPKDHHALAHQISQQGLILSEYPLGTPPLPGCFPQRNRIIAGLASGTLVVEATLKSGSLITAKLAAECGREVLAIPGSIHSPQSRGCHALIKQGAKLVETASDVLEEIPPISGLLRRESPTGIPESGSPVNNPLLELMGYDPIGLDGLSERSGTSPATLSAQLLELELDGQVARLPGQLFQRLSRG